VAIAVPIKSQDLHDHRAVVSAETSYLFRGEAKLSLNKRQLDEETWSADEAPQRAALHAPSSLMVKSGVQWNLYLIRPGSDPQMNMHNNDFTDQSINPKMGTKAKHQNLTRFVHDPIAQAWKQLILASPPSPTADREDDRGYQVEAHYLRHQLLLLGTNPG
jgi:hypothetical protein